MEKSLKKRISLLLMLILILTSCQGGSRDENSQKNENKIEITDITGNTISLDKPLEKVLIQGSGSGGPFMSMMYLDNDNFYKKIAGMDDGLEKYRYDLYERLVKKIPDLEKIERVSDFSDNDFSLEKILKIDCDAIIAPLSYKAQLDSIKDKIDIPIIYINYHSQDLDDHIKSTEIIAKATGLDKNLDKLNSFYKQKIDYIKDKLKNVDDIPLVYLEHGYDGEDAYGNSYGNSFMWGKILSDLKVNNLAGNVLDEKEASPIAEEYLLSNDPDIIVLTGARWVEKPNSVKIGFDIEKSDINKKIASYKKREGWADLSAIRKKNVYVIGQNLVRDMSDFYAYEVLAKAFYKDVFSNLDPESDMKEFYDNFMPIDYEGVWFYKYE